MVKKVRKSYVAGGAILPLGQGFGLAIGKHPEKVDDIDIGPNNKTGLSVNHGEILQQKGNTLRVFSAEPMLGGVSPVQLLYGGMAPDKVFAMQEAFKDIHGINDDGSRQKFQNGGQNIPLKLSDIPHDRPIHIIDNYSKNFNYIVQGDKIYYMKKGLTDNWVDISTNDVARSNLFNFLNDRYQFKGYGDREKEIYSQLKSGTYKYTNDNTNNNTNNVDNSDNTKQWAANYLKTHKTDVSDIVRLEQDRLSQEEKTKTAKPILNIKPAYPISGGVVPFADQVNYNSLIENIKNNFDDFSKTAKSYIKRGTDKYLRKEKTISVLENENYDDKESEYGIIPKSFTGDTISVPGIKGRYILPESLDLNDFSFGVRNRGDYKDLPTSDAPITSIFPFQKRNTIKDADENKTYMGIDNNGNFKIGKITDFDENDEIARVYSNKIYNINKDDKGNYILHNAKGQGPMYSYAIADMDDGKGNIKKGDIQLLLKKGDSKAPYYFGSVQGGRYIIEVGNEKRLVSGSLDTINKEFENMKKRHGSDYGIFYSLDNGSFSKGLRIKNRNITGKDLKEYDNDNSGGGGNIAYILGQKQNKYPSDTISTPNIRTINDESYKLGHSLINERKGIVLHHTGFSQNDSLGVRQHFQNPKSQASAHVVIMENGDRKVYGTPEQVTFHAGQSRFNGKFNVNDFMLGVEFNNPNTQNTPLTDAQIESFIEWAKPIIRENNINLENITTHEEVRKQYNEYVKAYKVKDDKGKTRKPTDSKVDISYKEYKRIIDALLKEVYYKKAFQFGGQTNINSLGERPNAKFGIEMSNPVKKANKYYERKLKEESPKMSFPERLQKDYEQLMSPPSLRNIKRRPYKKYKLDEPKIQIDSTKNNSENKRNKALYGWERDPNTGFMIPSLDFSQNRQRQVLIGNNPSLLNTQYNTGTFHKGIQQPSVVSIPKKYESLVDVTLGKNNPQVTTPTTTSTGDLTKGGGLSTTAMSAIGAGINTLGSLIGAGIQQGAINSLEAPQRQYTLLNPVKLKTKINIEPQLAKLREMQAQIADAARRTSGSSREAYRRILAGHNRLLESAMALRANQENQETQLINQDRLNQQRVAHTNATNVMNTVNYNNEAATEMRNRKRVATSNNWTTALNTIAGAWAGPNGFIDKANALRVKAGELYTQAIANPTAARLLYGDIDFTTDAGKRRAFNTIYDFLNNNRFA